MSRRLYSILLCVCLSVAAYGQAGNDTIDRLADDYATVSLLVCTPAEHFYSTLGHAAIRLQCPAFGKDYIFSYESEGIQDNLWKFLRGDLKMGMIAIPAADFFRDYHDNGRGVMEYEFNLSPAQKLKLWNVMDNHLAEGLNLPYDYFRRGCAISIVNQLHEAVGENGIHYAPWSEKYKRHTVRELCRDFITGVPWTEFLLYFSAGPEVDEDCPYEQRLIIPADLAAVWQRATLDNGKAVIAREQNVLVEHTKPIESTWFTPLLASVLLMLLAIGSLLTLRTDSRFLRTSGTAVDYAVLVTITALGALMTFLLCLSKLPCTDWNWLIVPFNILPAALWYWRRYWALPWAVMVLVWCASMTGMFLWGHILVDTAHILLALSFAVVLFKQWYCAKHNL